MLAAHLALAVAAAAPAQDTAALPAVAAIEAGTEVRAIEPELAAPVETPAPAVPAADPAAPEDEIRIDDKALALQSFNDPLEPVNRVFFAISQPIDRLVIRPASVVFKTVVPKPARDGARNFLSNFGEPIVILNDLVQFRPGRAFKTLGRFMINTIFGFGGFIDVAKKKPFNIPHRNNNFADTLGYYGIGPVIYVYLPVLGPTTLRDSAGSYGDSYFLDRNMHKLIHPNGRSPYFRTKPRLGKSGQIVTLVDGLDKRVESDDDLRHIMEDSVDPYAAMRASYMQDRAGEIAELKAKDGQAPKTEAFDDPLIDPGAAAPKP